MYRYVRCRWLCSCWPLCPLVWQETDVLPLLVPAMYAVTAMFGVLVVTTV